MQQPSLFQKSLTKIWDIYSKDVGKSLIHLGAVGWLFGALAQVGALAFNKKIDKDEKRFLFPQEIADGVINVGLYYTICQGIKSFADKCVDKGSFIPENVHKAYEKLLSNKQLFTTDEQTQIFGSKKNITGALNKVTDSGFVKKLSPAAANFVNNEIKPAAAKMAGWKNGIGTIATFAASVLACNIITPYARNAVASKIQNMTGKKTYYDYKAYGKICSFAQSKTFSKFKI